MIIKNLVIIVLLNLTFLGESSADDFPDITKFKLANSNSSDLINYNTDIRVDIDYEKLPLSEQLINFKSTTPTINNGFKSISITDDKNVVLTKWRIFNDEVELYFNISKSTTKFVYFKIIGTDDKIYKFKVLFNIVKADPYMIDKYSNINYYTYKKFNNVKIEGIINAFNIKELKIVKNNNTNAPNTSEIKLSDNFNVLDNNSITFSIYLKDHTVDPKDYSLKYISYTVDNDALVSSKNKEEFLISDLSSVLRYSDNPIVKDDNIQIFQAGKTDIAKKYYKEKEYSIRFKPFNKENGEISLEISGKEYKPANKYNDYYIFNNIIFPKDADIVSLIFKVSNDSRDNEKRDIYLENYDYPVLNNEENKDFIQLNLNRYTNNQYWNFNDCKIDEFEKKFNNFSLRFNKKKMNGMQYYKIELKVIDENNKEIKMKKIPVYTFNPEMTNQDYFDTTINIVNEHDDKFYIEKWYKLVISIKPVFESYGVKDMPSGNSGENYEWSKSFFFKKNYRFFPTISVYGPNVLFLSNQKPSYTLINVNIGTLVKQISVNEEISDIGLGITANFLGLDRVFDESTRACGITISPVISYQLNSTISLSGYSGIGLIWFHEKKSRLGFNLGLSINASLNPFGLK